jgi:molybdopterin synthase catalytic subunit
MRVRLLAFATAGEALGGDALEVELPEGSRLADLRARLEVEHPRLRELWPRLAVAVDGELAGSERALAEGCEVALLPPVSGGAPERVALLDGALDPGAIEAAVCDSRCGATVLFVGRVRGEHRGRAVTGIRYHAYRPLAAQRLAAIAAELEAAEPGLAVAIHHRLGELAVGEASVVVAVGAPHRDAAWRASRQAVERLKREVPIWKLERYADGSTAWREDEPLLAPQPATLVPAAEGAAR